tara:strand:- start:168 stop:506 length:339 start_codon:yes stop_codon:yes gene_type:complete
MKAIIEVRLIKDSRIYLNDGMYGIFWELRFKGHDRYPARVLRGSNELEGSKKLFKLYGPTCDESDELPGLINLPEDIQVGDYIEFSNIGAYSLSGRTNFNGFKSNQIIIINN